MRPTIAVLAILFVPLCAYAASAGFPSGHIWLSKESAVSGEKIVLFTVIKNSTEQPVSGNVIFEVDKKQVDIQPFETSAGASSLITGMWSAAAGTHSISARIESPAPSSLVNGQATGQIQITVTNPPPPPPPSAIEKSTRAISTKASEIASSTSPILSSLLGRIEAMRQRGIAKIEAGLAKENTSLKPAVLGTSTKASSERSAITSLMQRIWNGALYVFKTKVLFYIFFGFTVLLLFFILRLLWRAARGG